MTRMSDEQFKAVCELIYEWGKAEQDVTFDFEEDILTSKLIAIFSEGNKLVYELELDGNIIGWEKHNG